MYRRYSLFISSIAANIDLRNKAMENGSFIELVVLLANRIDASLRLAIILTNQIEQQNTIIDLSLIYQDEADKPLTERSVYKLALERSIINRALFDTLESLYNDRNKVVHRYIITDLRTEDVVKISSRYFDVEREIDDIVNRLEQKQFEIKAGINGISKTPPNETLSENDLKKLTLAIRDKHGGVRWPDKKL